MMIFLVDPKTPNINLFFFECYCVCHSATCSAPNINDDSLGIRKILHTFNSYSNEMELADIFPFLSHFFDFCCKKFIDFVKFVAIYRREKYKYFSNKFVFI